MSRNPYAKSLRVKAQQVVPDKRADGLLAAMRAEYEQEIQRLREEDPDWVKELLDRLS
jgi:hypothetical protein